MTDHIEFKGKKYNIENGFLDLGLLEITDINQIKGLESKGSYPFRIKFK